MNNSHPLEAVGRGTETHLQVALNDLHRFTTPC